RVLGEDHRRTASNLSHLARLRRAQGRAAEAEAFYRDALDRLHRVMADHPNTAHALLDFAAFLHEQGRPADAEAHAREALTILSARYGDDDWRTAAAHGDLGRYLAALHRFDEAEAALARSVALLEAHHG